MKINAKRLVQFFTLLVLLTSATTTGAQSAAESSVRAVVQQVFSQLQSHDYSSVYDSLPSATRRRISKPGFIKALQRAQDRYALDRIEIGKIRVSGNLAVADTELFGRITQPFASEGKIVVQQYLVREDGKWRVATGDNATIQRFLKSNPGFGGKFPLRQPRIYMKQNNKWIELSAVMRREAAKRK